MRSYRRKDIVFNECDAACGDVTGAGDIGAPQAVLGTSTTDVLGACDHTKDGYMGTDCFHIPAKAQVPLHRWEVANGGSRRKKDKKGKDKHYAYEKGMKTVVKMFEAEHSNCWLYFEAYDGNEAEQSYNFRDVIDDPKLKSQVTTHLDGTEIWYDGEIDQDKSLPGNPWQRTDVSIQGGFMKIFQTKDAAKKFALDRIHDACLVSEFDAMAYDDEDGYQDERDFLDNEQKEMIASMKSSNSATLTDGEHAIWACQIVEM